MSRWGVTIIVTFLALQVQAAPSCRIEVGERSFNLNQTVPATAQGIRPALELLSQLEVTRERAREAVARLGMGGLKVSALDAKAKEMAEYAVEESRPTLKLKGGELGLTAAHLLHELVHALDDEFAPQTFSLPLGIERDRMVFSAERLAYDTQREWLVYLYSYYSCARDYFEYHAEQKQLVTQTVSDEALIETYHLHLE